MRKITALAIFLAAICIGAGVETEPTKTSESTVSSTASDTTTPKLDTTSDVVTTTTSQETTTTPEPTTKPTVDTTTTTPTETTTPVATTTVPSTVAPTSKPPATEKGKWNVVDGNLTCIRAEMEALFVIPVEGRNEYIALSPNASSNQSTCHNSNVTQKLILEGSNYQLDITFEKSSQDVFVKDIVFSYTLPQSHDTVENKTKLFLVKSGNSYMCVSQQDVQLQNITLELSHVQIQAFLGEGNKGFGTAEQCEMDNVVSDVVPIAVGCALAALIVVVLVAYLIGRRRTRQKGYQSV